MKPVFQTVFGEGKGNCLSASIASLLEMNIEDVPNFSEYGNQFWPECWKWLRERNIAMIDTTMPPKGYQLVCVHSPRGDFLHSMVCLDGEPIHDPHPEGHCQHNGIDCYSILYPLDPSKPMGVLSDIGNESEA